MRWTRLSVLFGVLFSLTWLLTGCGGGGGSSVGTGTLNITGTAQFANSPNLVPLSDATVRAYLYSPTQIQPVGDPVQTNNEGRYTLSLPANSVVGKDLVIVAEKTVNNKPRRVMTLCLAVRPEGATGIDMEPFTTYATEEVLRIAKANNLSQIAPNGFSEVVRQVREQFQDAQNLPVIVGETLPQQIGEGIQDNTIRPTVREIVENQDDNLRPPQGDVAVAKSMMQMIRDANISAVGIADTEATRLEEDLSNLEQVIEREVVTPVKKLGDRGLQYLFSVLSEDEFRYPPLIGLPPGRYEHYRNGGTIQIRRIGSTDNRTWEIVNNVPNDRFQGVTVRIVTQNPLQRLDIDPNAGKYTVQVRSSRDPRLQYDVVLEVTRKDSQNRPTQLRATMNLVDSQLSQPIQFNGTVGLTPRPGEDLSFSQVRFTGTFTSQYGSLNVTNLVANIDENQSQQRNQVSAQCEALQLTVRTSRNASVEIRGLNLQYIETWDGDILTPAELRVQSIRVNAGDASLVLSNARLQLVPNSQDERDYPANMTGQLEYRTPKATLTGSLEFVWENASTARLDWDWWEVGDEIPLEWFPKGYLKLTSANLTPSVGRPIALNFTLRLEPNASPPRMRLETLRLSLGSEVMQGTGTAQMDVSDGRVNRQQLFSNATLTMTHSPSNFQVALTMSTSSGEYTFSGEIKKPDGTRIAQIGKARDLGMPDLGNLLIVKYNDGTFESLQSLLPSR